MGADEHVGSLLYRLRTYLAGTAARARQPYTCLEGISKLVFFPFLAHPAGWTFSNHFTSSGGTPHRHTSLPSIPSSNCFLHLPLKSPAGAAPHICASAAVANTAQLASAISCEAYICDPRSVPESTPGRHSDTHRVLHIRARWQV